MENKSLEAFHKQTELIRNAQMYMLKGDFISAKQYAKKSSNSAFQVFEFSEENAPYLSGTYVNMALAEYIQYQCDQTNEKNIEFVRKAYELTEKALTIKPTNQQALVNSADFSIILENYENAANKIEKLSLESFDALFLPQMEGILSNILASLLKMEKRENSKESLNHLFSAIERKIRNEKIVSQLLFCQAQVYSILGDVTGAYALLSQALKGTSPGKDYVSAYYLMCQLCIDPQLQKKQEALRYGELAFKYLDSDTEINMKASILSNYGRAICLGGKEEGLAKCREAINIYPNESTYYNYARSLYEFKKYQEASSWATKALLLCDDELNLVLMADIYRALNNYESAIEYYKKAIWKMRNNNSLQVLQYQDETGEMQWSFTSSYSISYILKYTFRSIIQCYIHIDMHKASNYLAIAEEQYPEEEMFEFLRDTLGLVQTSLEEIKQLKSELFIVKEDALKQKKMSIGMIKRIISIQDESITMNMDSYEDWKDFSKKMDVIINGLEQQAKSNKKLMQSIQENISFQYPLLKGNPLHFLITAEALYEIHKGTVIDFGCIILEYVKVCEYQLRDKLSRYLSPNDKMLGNVIYVIKNNGLSPYSSYIDYLNTINSLRKRSAHTGLLSQKDADRIKEIYFDKGFLHILEK